MSTGLFDDVLGPAPSASTGLFDDVLGEPADSSAVTGGLRQSLVARSAERLKGAALGWAQGYLDVARPDADPALGEILRAKRAESDQRMNELMPDIKSPTLRAVYGGVESTIQQAPGLALGLATGSAVPSLAYMGATTAGESYGRYKGRGATTGEALRGTAIDTAAEVGFEIAPTGFFLKNFGKMGLGKFLTGLLGRELVTELPTTVVQGLNDTLTANPNATVADWARGLPADLRDTAIATVTQSVLMGGASAGVNRLRGNRAESVERERFRERVGEPQPATTGLFDDVLDLDAVAGAYANPEVPQLTGPAPAPDFTVDARGRAARPGETRPDDLALPAPQASGQYQVTPEGVSVPLTQAEAALVEQQRQGRAALGLGEAERIAWRRVMPAELEAAPEPMAVPAAEPAPVAEPAPLADRLQSDPDFRQSFAALAKETGWDTVGGRSMGKAGPGLPGQKDVEGSTPWLPRYPWFKDVPTDDRGKRLSETAIKRVIALTLAGKKLGVQQRRVANYLLEVAADRIAAVPYQPAPDILAASQLEDNGADADETALVARAAELDDAVVERLAVQYEDDNDGFLRAVRAFLDSQAAPALERSAGSVTQEAQQPAAINRDLFAGSDQESESLARRNAVESERLRREAKLTGNVSVETGNPNDLFSQARKQTDLTDRQEPPREQAQPDTITDVGEKIGGARKDTSVAGRPRSTVKKDEAPGWRKRYQVSQIARGDIDKDGRWTIRDTRKHDRMGRPTQVGGWENTFATQEEAEAAIPLAEVSRNHRVVAAKDGKYAINRIVTDRKRVRVVAQLFDSREAAMRYMAEHAVEIIETRTSFGEEILPRPDKVRRIGPARREGDAKGDDFLRDFGFRGVEFGNWEAQDERQTVMNHAYDALMDLADVLGVPPRALGLNGELALAFGARGQGLSGARAHYEPDYGVINLTKMSGAGSLAHEWMHAADHYFGRQDGKASAERVKNERGDTVFKASGASDFASYGTRGEKSAMRAELREAYDAVISTMLTKAEKYVEDTQKADRFVQEARNDVAQALQRIRDYLSKPVQYKKRNNQPASAEQLAAFDEIANKIIEGEYLELQWVRSDKARSRFGGYRWSNDGLQALSDIFKQARGSSGFNSTNQSGVFDNLAGNIKRYAARLKMLADAQSETTKERKLPTSFATEAKRIDQGRASDYWATPHEMAARAFQSYVEDRVADRGGKSDFLTYGTNVALPTPWGWARPFPEGDERKAIDKAFDRFVGVLRTRETERGTMLYSNPIEAMFRVGQGMARQAARANERAERLFGTNPPPVQPNRAEDIPPKVEAGGGIYTTAPFQGMDPQVQRVILDVMSAEEANIADERGNAGEPITWEQTGSEAQALLDGAFGRTFNSLVNRLPRSTANAKLLESFARIVNTAGKNVQAAVEQYNRTGSAQDLAHLTAAREQLGVVLAPFMGYRTEAGRALNILRKVQADFADAQQIFEALGDGNEQAMKDFARRVKEAGSVAEVLEITRASYRPTALDQFREYWINSILSGPWTHIVNIASNTAFNLLDASTELAVSVVSNKVSTRAALARFTGMMAGMRLGVVNAKKAFATEEPQLNQQAQIEGRKHQAISGRKGRIIRLPGRLLMAEDEFAKAVNYTGTLYRMAMEQAVEQNPSDPYAVFDQILAGYANNRAVKARAKAEADRLTFQTPLGKLGQYFMRLRDETKVGFLIAPFIRTPTNILKQAATYSPAALAMPSVREQLKAGGRDQHIALGRMMIGSTFMFSMFGLVLQGMMTGAGPDDPGERALWMRSGKKPYSIKVGDEWVRYNRFEPIGMLMGISADMAELSATVGKGQYDRIATMVWSSIMLNLADKTYLRGLFDAIEAANDPKRYLARWASNLAGGVVVPNIVAQGARATDPFVRDARGIVDSLKGRVPGLRQQLPAKLDIAGQPIERSIFEPAASTPERDDPLAQTMLSLGVFKRPPGRKINLRGRSLELSSAQYASLAEFVQKTRWEKLTPIVQSEGFGRMAAADPLRAQRVLGNAYDRVGDAARLMWLQQNPTILDELRAAPLRRREPSNYAEARP